MDSGLENIVAAETGLSDVDGTKGRLVIRGWLVEALAASATWEEATHLLWDGFFEALPETGVLASRTGAARVAAFKTTNRLPALADIVSALRIGWASLEDDESLETAIAIAASAPVFTAAAVRKSRGLAPIAPNADLSASADLLRMMTGDLPSPEQVRALDAYLVTVCDHGLNASTFAARVVASTRAGLGSAAIAGLSALKGPLHGGAPGPVLDMLDAIGTPEAAE